MPTQDSAPSVALEGHPSVRAQRTKALWTTRCAGGLGVELHVDRSLSVCPSRTLTVEVGGVWEERADSTAELRFDS